MQKIAVCGLGKDFQDYFTREDFLTKRMEERDIKIVGFLDGDVSKIHSEILYNGAKYHIARKDEWRSLGADKIYITSRKYYTEIKGELIGYGCSEEEIYPLEILLSDCLNDFYSDDMFKGKKGIEIGGPSWIFRNIYHLCESCDGVNYSEETVWWGKGKSKYYSYNGAALGEVFIAEATDLTILHGKSYDFVLSSNSLEHIANPVKALEEYCKILSPGGVMVTVVPVKERTFDHNREETAFEHLLSDYEKDVKEDDLTHLPEILRKHDYDMDTACGGKEVFAERAAQNYKNRCLHHHVFSESCLRHLYHYFHLEILNFANVFGNYYIVGKK